MSSPAPSPQSEVAPTNPPVLPPTTTVSSIPQKRALEDDHQPTVSSPLNPDFKPSKLTEDVPLARERVSRPKKESLKKRESKGPLVTESSSRSTPDPKGPVAKHKRKGSVAAPMRYKLPPPKTSDFEAPRGPVFVEAHEKVAPDGSTIEFQETTEQ